MNMSDDDVKEEQKKFIRTCSELYDNTSLEHVSQFRESMEEYRKRINKLQTALTKEIRSAIQFQRTALTEKKHEDWHQEFLRITSHPQVKDVQIDRIYKTINILTTTINCRNPDTGILHELGEFLIIIPLKFGSISWINRTRSVEIESKGWNMQAPHVLSADGDACLGSYDNLFVQLIANYEFAAAVSMAITFLESVDPSDSAGRYITRFPVAEEK